MEAWIVADLPELLKQLYNCQPPDLLLWDNLTSSWIKTLVAWLFASEHILTDTFLKPGTCLHSDPGAPLLASTIILYIPNLITYFQAKSLKISLWPKVIVQAPHLLKALLSWISIMRAPKHTILPWASNPFYWLYHLPVMHFSLLFNSLLEGPAGTISHISSCMW